MESYSKNDSIVETLLLFASIFLYCLLDLVHKILFLKRTMIIAKLTEDPPDVVVFQGTYSLLFTLTHFYPVMISVMRII